MKFVLMFGAIVCLLLMYFIAKSTSAHVCDILSLPLSPDISDLKKLVFSVPSEKDILDKLIRMYAVDMLFIFFYTAVLVFWTHNEMNRSSNLWMNYTLRVNLIFIVLTGLLDAIENVIMWYNFQVFGTDANYLSSREFALIKYILVGWTLLSLFISKLIRKFSFEGLKTQNP